MDVDMELYNKMLKVGIFKVNPKVRVNFDKKKAQLDSETTILFENGQALGKYLLVLKEAMKRNNQDLNVDSATIQQLKTQGSAQTRLFNWNLLCNELDKVGISIDSDNKSLIVAGDHEQILIIFQRIERFIGKIAGKQVLNLEGIKSEAHFQAQDSGVEDKGGNARRGGKPSQKKKVIKDGVDILTMNADRELQDTESTLEFILNTLCKAFGMKPKQAAALLTNNNQFLIHSIVKGVKGRYDPLINWYQDIYANSKHLTVMLELEAEQFPAAGTTPKVLATLSCGLYSHNLDICRWCCKLLTKVGYDFAQNQQMFALAMKWFLEKEGGLELMLHTLKKHPDMVEDFVTFVTQYALVNNQIDQIYKVDMKKLFSSPQEYVNVINDIFPFLVQQCQKELIDSGLIDYWVDSSIKQSDNDGKHSYNERISALTLLCEVWLQYTSHIDSKEEVVNQITQMLKRAVRDRHRPIRTVAICQMFKLLDKFSEQKNNSAPGMYKTLIFSLVENPNDPIIRELYFVNFIQLFEQHPSIPINLLVDPLVKQIQVSENVTYFYEIFDFELFQFIAKHPKLSLQSAILLVDLLAKVYLNEVNYSTAAAVAFIQICARFIHDEEILEFLLKFETICLSMLMNLEKNAEELQLKHAQALQALELAKNAKPGQKKILALPAPDKSIKRQPAKRNAKEEKLRKQKEEEEDLNRRLKKVHIVEITKKIQNLRNEEINDQLRDMLLSSNKRFNELYGYFNKGIMALLRWWGDPDQIMSTYIRALEEKAAREREEQERKEREEQERIRREQEEKERLEREEREARQREHEEKMKQMMLEAQQDRLALGYESADGMMTGGDGSTSLALVNRNSMAVLPYTGAKNNRKQKALQEIEKIKRTKLEKEEQKRLDEERKRLLSARNKKKLKEQLQKRKVELGIAKGTPNDDIKALIYDRNIDEANTLPKGVLKYDTLIPQIKLLDLDEEEERDKEAVEAFMKKYSKLWKNLYYKYANSGFSSKQISSFTQLNEKLQTINFAEMTKLLKDHSAYPQLINKDELQTIFRLINTKLFNRHDLTALDYDGYLALIPQLAFFCFTRAPRDLSHLPPVETLRALVTYFEKATRQRGNSTVLYEDPDYTSIGDMQLIKALTDKINMDPSYPIPEGYFKVKESSQVLDYRIPDIMRDQMDESKVIGVELLDELLNNLFGIHLLEPLVSVQERWKVRPMIKNMFSAQGEQAAALSYMKKVEKRIRPIDDRLNPYASLSSLDKNKLMQEVKPQLNVTLKLEVAAYPLKERPHVQEVAETLEEILQASEKGLSSLPPRLNRAPGQVWNEAKQKRYDDFTKEKEDFNIKEDKRKKRDELVKNELQRIKEAKEKELEDAKKAKEEKDKQDALNKKKQLEEARKKLEDKRKALEDQKIAKLDEVKRKKEEDDEKNKDEIERKKKERAEYMKKHKQQLQEEFKQVKEEREQVLQKQEELKKKEQEYQMKIRQQMESFIKEHQDDKIKEQEERKAINEFLKLHDVESVFSLYDKSLRHMYKFYASQDKKDLDFNLERAMNSINFREFVRFNYQQNITPALLPPEDVVYIYRQLIRERIEQVNGSIDDNYLNDKNNAQVLDYEFFKKALVRIAIMAQGELGGIEDQLLAKLEQETKNKAEQKRMRDKAKNDNPLHTDGNQDVINAENEGTGADKSSKNKQGSATGKGQATEEVKFEINQEARAKEDAFFDKWVKQREAKGISLKKRIIGQEKDGSKKIIKKKKVTLKKEGGDLDNVREGDDLGVTNRSPSKRNQTASGTLLPGQSPAGGLTMRKTKALKELQDLSKQEQIKDQLANTKIEDRRVRKDLDMSVISPRTIEALLRFLGIEPDDTIYRLDKKLNQARIEIQGQKPTKVKKQMKAQQIGLMKDQQPSAVLNTSQDMVKSSEVKAEVINEGDEGLENGVNEE